jgi:hypothetical protein
MPSFINICEREFRVEGRLLRIARVEGEGYRFLATPHPILEKVRGCGTRIDIFTFTQRVTETERKYDFPMERDNFAVLPISTFDHWWNEQIGFKARNKAKQAEKKGVVIKEAPFDEHLVQGIWQIYNETPIRQGRRFPHYGKTLDQVREEEATFLDSSVFIGAYLSDRLVGFVKLVHDETKTQAGLMNILSLVAHRDKAPTNALVARAVRSCAERQIAYLVYSRFAYGKKEQSSLADFKERNGFQRVDIPRYYVPLTAAGRLALRVGLHHKLVDRLPEALAGRLRELRAAWYNRRFKSVSEAI